MTRAELLAFMRRHPLAVEATVSRSGAPQAAVVGVVTTDAFELIFDTVTTSRKYQNLEPSPRMALVMGWDEEQTVQFEGVADIPSGDELASLQTVYLAGSPDGRSRLCWPGLVYVRVKPMWIRYSDFRAPQPKITEFQFPVPLSRH
jgi:hypothetical protein